MEQFGRSTDDVSIPNIEDFISEDGILCKILSSLPLREAVRTCNLSPRWRSIWTHLPKLSFNSYMLDIPTRSLLVGPNRLLSNEEKIEVLEGKKDYFIRSVDSVLQHCRIARVEEFYIHYYLTNVDADHLDAWVHFALKSNTRKLAINLRNPYFNEVETQPYDFPYKLLESSSSLDDLTLMSCNLKPPCGFVGVTHLRKLNLYYIDLTEKDVNHLLSNCFTLESLTLWSAPRLVKLSMPHALGHFHYLYVKHCNQLTEININAANLVQLRYWGPPVDFIFRQSSQLKDAKIFYQTGVSEPNLDFYLNKLSRSLPRLQSLLFHVSGVSQVTSIPRSCSGFTHLTSLDWTWTTGIKMSLTCLATLLDAAPLLGELKLRLWTNLQDGKMARVVEPPPQSLRKLRNMLPEHTRTHLRTIGIHNFFWDKWQIEIALYLLKNSIALELMTLQKGPNSTEILETDINNLRKEGPPNVKLFVL